MQNLVDSSFLHRASPGATRSDDTSLEHFPYQLLHMLAQGKREPAWLLFDWPVITSVNLVSHQRLLPQLIIIEGKETRELSYQCKEIRFLVQVEMSRTEL